MGGGHPPQDFPALPPNTEVTIDFPSTVGVDNIAAAGDQNTTERTVTIPATPTGRTIVRVLAACILHILNNGQAGHTIDVDIEGRLGAGAWTNWPIGNDYLGLPAGVTYATDGDVPMADVSALVVAAGNYGFRLVVNQSGGANSVIYKTQFLIKVTYRMTP